MHGEETIKTGLTHISHKDRREKSESAVDTGKHRLRGTRRKTLAGILSSMLRMFFKRNAVDAVLNGFAAVRL